MTQMLNTADYITRNNETLEEGMALAASQSGAAEAATRATLERDLAEIASQYQAWLAFTYLPGVPKVGADALYSVALNMSEMSQGSLEVYYVEVADAFKVALASVDS